MTVHMCKLELLDDRRVIYTAINGSTYSGAISLPKMAEELLDRFNYWIAKDKLNETDDLKLVGTFLYDVLLPGRSEVEEDKAHSENGRVSGEEDRPTIRRQFQNDYYFVKRKMPGDSLRLTLVFHKEAKKLVNYPWEFLYMDKFSHPAEGERAVPLGGFFLAGQATELILTRFVPNVSPVFAEGENELRILVVFSHPEDGELADIDIKATREAIEMIGKLEQNNAVRVRVIETPTPEELYKAVNEPSEKEKAFKPHIVHFVGRGDRDRGLALKMGKKELEERKAMRLPEKAFWLDQHSICDLLGADEALRLVFLHACETARVDSQEGVSDLARELVYTKIPAVVAMQYAIKTSDAAMFAKIFYQELSIGKDIDEAVRAGRTAMGLPEYGGKGSWSDRRFGTPVVYLQTEKAIITMPKRPSPRTDDVDPNRKVPCPNPRCDCSIFLDYVICVGCGHDVMICPTCRASGDYRLMDKTLGRCGKCGYGMPDRQPTPPGAAAGSALDAAKSEAPPPAAPAPQRSAQNTPSPAAQAVWGTQGVSDLAGRPDGGAVSTN